MKKLFLLLILSFFSTTSYAGYLDDWTDDQLCGWMDKPSSPEHIVAEVKKRGLSCGGDFLAASDSTYVLNAPKAEFYQRQYDMSSKVDQILAKRKTINPFLQWGYHYMSSGNYYGIAWTSGSARRLFPNNMLELETPTWNYYYIGKSWGFWRDNAKQKTFVTGSNWGHDAGFGETKAMNIIDPAYPKAFAEEAHAISEDGIHGVMLDWWNLNFSSPYPKNTQQSAMIRITDEIRKQVGDDFLILGNTNWKKNPNLVNPINGVFLELWRDYPGSYGSNEIAEMEGLIKFHEKHLRYPRLIAFEPMRIFDNSDPYNRTSEEDLRFARLFSAMATVIPEHGYIQYPDNQKYLFTHYGGKHDHHYYDVYKVDLGKPVSKYTPIAKGVAYKKFEYGYIAFSRLEYDVTVNFGDFESVIPSMDAVFLNEDGTPYVGCEEGFIKKDGICMVDDSPLFSEDFENTDQRDVRVDVSSGKWYIKPDNDGNSIYCNKATDGESNLTVGSKDWSDYSFSYRMKFPAGKGGKLQTQIRQTDEVGRYSAIIDNLSGSTTIKYVERGDRYSEQRIASGFASTKADEWSEIQLIASGNNIKYLVDGEVVASAKDNRIKKGAGMIAVSANSEVCVDDIVVNKI